MTYNKIALGFDNPFTYQYKADEIGRHFRAREYDKYEIKNNKNMNDLEDHLAGIQSPGAVVGGLVLVHESTIGSAVSSHAVTNVFSSRYESYRILVNGGNSSATNATIRMRLGTTNTGYYASYAFHSYAATPATLLDSDTNGTYWTQVGNGSTVMIAFSMDIHNPYLSDQTTFNGLSNYASTTTGGQVISGGYLNNTTSYTDFTLSPASGTFTGSRVRVYGYRMA